MPAWKWHKDGRVAKKHLRAFALSFSVSHGSVGNRKRARRERVERKAVRERKEKEEGGGFVLAFMHWASRFRLQVSNRKTAIVVGSYLLPPQVDFTVNRASPLVTEGQCTPLPPFQACGSEQPDSFLNNPVILAPFSLPLFLLTEHTNRAWKMASLLGKSVRPDPVIFYNTGIPSTPLCSHRN